MKFRHHSIMGAIYCCLLAIPMVSVLARVIYVQSNKNAYQSYSGTTTQIIKQLKYETNEVNSSNDLVIGNIYQLNLNNASDGNYGNFISYWADNFNNDIDVYSDVIIDYLVYFDDTYDYDFFPDDEFLQKSYTFNRLSLESGQTFYNFNYVIDECLYGSISIYADDNINNHIDFIFTGTGDEFGFIIDDICSWNSGYISASSYVEYEYIEIESSTLDNVFDYSLSKFVSDNDFGKLNLFSWFYNIFLSEGNNNALYIHFVNWYMNYALLVSSTYILFLVLMWFINFSRRILERGMNYDW